MSESNDDRRRFATLAVHAGQRPEATTGAITTPVFQTSTYVQPRVGNPLGYEYARGENPTREALEGNLAALEAGANAVAFSSGLAAIEAVALSQLVDLVEAGRVTAKNARDLVETLIVEGGDPVALVAERGLEALSDSSALEPIADEVLAEHPEAVASYRAGEGKSLNFLMGQVMRKTQGKADAGITTNTAVKPIAEQYENIIAGPRMPWTTDYTSVVGPRKDFGWPNYLNLFVTHQVRSGRYQELWGQFVGGEAPELRIPGVMY